MKTLILISTLALTAGLCGCSGLLEHENMFTGSKWELYGYKDASLAQIQPLTDTLEFGSIPNYTYNHVGQSYQLFTTNNGNQTVRLQLNNTRFGTVSGMIQTASVSSGTILGETFSRATDGVEWQLWFRKI